MRDANLFVDLQNSRSGERGRERPFYWVAKTAPMLLYILGIYSPGPPLLFTSFLMRKNCPNDAKHIIEYVYIYKPFSFYLHDFLIEMIR